MSDQINAYRRKFIAGLAGVTAIATVAPSIVLREVKAKTADEASTDSVRWGLLIDTNKLTESAIDAGIEACKKRGWGDEKHSNDRQDSHWIRKVKVTDKTTRKEIILPVMCQHCETAPCVDVCPTGASFKRPDGVVLVDKHICIGCRYCMMACPYKARSFVHETIENQRSDTPRGKGTVESCDLCIGKIDIGEEPACVKVSGGAIVFGDLKDPESNISKSLKEFGGTQIRADLGLNTGVRYQGI
ncbi:MAG TPA: 4Fe-4S dicluster domain-containing protein [Leucothrix mucor]|uniref:4Fe-4S dicluster domain-containing protein n=1 Tax=Leucothrix mucor TaxID=45248 RepID=A0A7V2T4C4_LEUMU|nr:4Fe-4S dicluster domain-containing protein [Leucothrix mucor]